ncbi:MAG TPA: serine--tRNA ligase, partial [Nitrospiraceae bacterium]|nr:serine--tRNA ligase [Nitrospiraceae bacterium]
MIMYDLRYLREHFDAVRIQLGSRASDVAWEDLRKLIQERHSLTTQVEQLRHQLKKGSEEVGRLKRDKQPAERATAEMKTLGDRIRDAEESLRAVEERVTELALRIPNLPHSSVPIGKNPADNQE